MKIDSSKPDDYMFEKKQELSAADVEKAKKEFEVEIAGLQAKLEERDKDLTKLKKMSPADLLNKF